MHHIYKIYADDKERTREYGIGKSIYQMAAEDFCPFLWIPFILDLFLSALDVTLILYVQCTTKSIPDTLLAKVRGNLKDYRTLRNMTNTPVSHYSLASDRNEVIHFFASRQNHKVSKKACTIYKAPLKIA